MLLVIAGLSGMGMEKIMLIIVCVVVSLLG
jgi:hypothetical protein